jgi:hypothetical protein
MENGEWGEERIANSNEKKKMKLMRKRSVKNNCESVLLT